MTTRPLFVRTLLCAAILVAAAGAAAIAGTPQAAGQDAAKPSVLPVIPVRIDVVLSRYQGEKKISSLPFSLLASAADAKDRASLTGQNLVRMRMGIDVPVGTWTGPSESKGAAGTRSTPDYRNVGTNIDCHATRLDEIQFSVKLDINDSSIYSPDGNAKGVRDLDPAAFRTFNASNTVTLRNGQTVVFGTGTDKISGEVLKIEVTLTVVK